MIKKTLIPLCILLLTMSCEKWPLFVGAKEFLTVEYRNTGTPEVTSSAIDQSPFIEHGSISAIPIGNGLVRITVDGIRVQSKQNNFQVDKIRVYEKDRKKFQKQDEFSDPESEENKTNIASVLVLDMSNSIKGAGLDDDLKSYAKQYVDIIVNSTSESKVAVVFFSKKEHIQVTRFFDEMDAQQLKDEIDAYNDFVDGTALFEATLAGIELIENEPFDGAKTVVTFTDGGDNDSDNPGSKINQIQNSDILKISIGLKGNDFSKDDLLDVASSRAHCNIVNKSDKLEKTFRTVARQVVSVYKVQYDRSDQQLDDFIAIKFEFEVDRIK